MKCRDFGYYWVMYEGSWEIMYYTGEKEWGYHEFNYYVDEKSLDKIGNKINKNEAI